MPVSSEAAGKDTLARAQDIIYDAWEARSPKRRVALALKALELSPLCADAYVLLAGHVPAGSNDELDLLRRAVAAAETALGEAVFDKHAGNFWAIFETRPYMRARSGLAQALWERGACEAATGHLRDLLRLNPNDNQGLRYLLAAYLLELGRDAELRALLAHYDDGSAFWTYPKALEAFRRAGDDRESRGLLSRAVASNPHVPNFLTRTRRLRKRRPAAFSVGGEDEAASYAGDLGAGWRQTPGALAWLRRRTAAAAD